MGFLKYILKVPAKRTRIDEQDPPTTSVPNEIPVPLGPVAATLAAIATTFAATTTDVPPAPPAREYCHCYGYYDIRDLELHNGLLGVILKNGAARKGDTFRLSHLLFAICTGNPNEPFEIKAYNVDNNIECLNEIPIEEFGKRSKGRYHCINCL